MEIISVNIQKGGSGKPPPYRHLLNSSVKSMERKFSALIPIRSVIFPVFPALILWLARNTICILCFVRKAP